MTAMRIHLSCTYCGTKWEAFANSKESIEDMKCGICGDSTLEVRDASKMEKIDYYAGSPPFPDKILAVKEPEAEIKKPWYWDTSRSSSSSTLKDS